jgi:hypothetical protein
VAIAKGLSDRKMQRALTQFFKPANWFEVRAALTQAKRANQGGDHCRTVANPAKGETPGEPPKTGHRPGRKTRQRRPGKRGP